MTPAATIAVDAPADVASKARYALEELARICGGASAPLSYPSQALPASEAAWRLFAGAEAPPPRRGDDGFVEFGDGVSDVVMSTFWHLARWEERAGSARDERGRFPASAALFDPEEAAADRLVERFREIAGSPPPGPLTVALTHDIDTPVRWSGLRAVAGAAARAKRAATG
ncbi:MAG: DUF7033 domain-containing protein, partial [Gaiellales bacterium]